MRIDRVYTRGGDAGETSLIGGDRVSKGALRLECYGTVDETNAALGLVRTALDQSAAGGRLRPIIHRGQNELFDLGCELATPDPAPGPRQPQILQAHGDRLEPGIRAAKSATPGFESFFLSRGR